MTAPSHNMMNTPLTLAAILERVGTYFPDVEVVSRLPQRSLHRCTWGEIYRRSHALANLLRASGLRKGERVATLMWNHYAHLEAYLAIPAAGGVLHPLNLRLHPDEIAYIANHAQDRFLIADDVLLPVLEKFASKTKVERTIIVRHCDNTAGSYEDYEALLAASPSEPQPVELSEQDGAAMCFTSGTTGNPKGVLYSHRALALHCMAICMADCCGLSHMDTLLLASPMFHVNGWGLPFSAAMVGAKTVFPGPHLDPASLLELIEQERVTFTCAVPTVWLGVLAEMEKRGARWRPQQDVRVMCGGTAPPAELIRGLDRHGFHLIHLWGMTETSPTGTISGLRRGMAGWSEDQKYAQRCKQGWPLPFIELRVMNDQGEAPWDSVTMGELEVRGPWVVASYYNAPGTEQRWSADGWFRTGDVAAIDPDGCIRLVDRSKDLVKSGGEWISSVDLENTLMCHPAVREAGVIAVAHPKWQERPLAVVVLKEGKTADPAELRAFLSQKFAKWQLPDDFIFVAELPHTSTGKLLKAELRKRYAGWKWTQPVC